MQILKKFALYFVLPVAVILILLKASIPAALLALAAYIGFIVYINQAVFYSWRGGQSYAKGDMDAALVWLDKANKSRKAKPQVKISYAYLLLKLGKLEEADKILTALIASHVDMESKMLAKSNYALVLWKQNKLDEAVELLRQVMESYRNSTVYGSLGYMLIQQGDLDEALAFNLEACDYNNSNKVILDNLGQTYYLREDYDKAEEIYARLIPQNPPFPEAYYNYGLVLMKKDQYAEAWKAFEKALGYKLTFLSTVTREQLEEQLEKAGKMQNAANSDKE
jgi:tetratricopeptide (TPR) repeat protein